MTGTAKAYISLGLYLLNSVEWFDCVRANEQKPPKGDIGV
jgi:hypothetical protein